MRLRLTVPTSRFSIAVAKLVVSIVALLLLSRGWALRAGKLGTPARQRNAGSRRPRATACGGEVPPFVGCCGTVPRWGTARACAPLRVPPSWTPLGRAPRRGCPVPIQRQAGEVSEFGNRVAAERYSVTGNAAA